MTTAERRKNILIIIYKRGHETVANLAEEFGVSHRTIRRDIESLSLYEPIYTVSGRYYGGVYYMENTELHLDFFDEYQTKLIQKILRLANEKKQCILSKKEISMLLHIKRIYGKPDKKNTSKKTLSKQNN